MKKGYSLSMSVIVTTVLALIVLVILIAAFTDYVGDAGDDIEHLDNDCEVAGGTCVSQRDSECRDIGGFVIDRDCPSNQFCCMV